MPIPQNDFPMSKTLLFLISGKAGVGKTFSASFITKLAKDAGFVADKFSFAAGVKYAARVMGWDGEKNSIGRAYLQKIGQLGRWYNENVWVDGCMEVILTAPTVPISYEIVCIDDWRFPNEYHRIVNNYPFIKVVPIRITSPEREILKGTEEYSEISEVALDNFELFNYVINNPVEDNASILTSLTDIVSLEILKNRQGETK